MTDQIITIDYGSGGKLTNQLIRSLFLKYFNNPILNKLHDGAVLPPTNHRIAFSTDSYTVSPIFFKGGNIGHLAINGTINDIAMCGAIPKYLSVSLIIEEGTSMQILEQITCSMAEAANKTGIQIVTGDTKVVNKGDVDGIFINTTGIGYIDSGVHIHPGRAQINDAIIINGPIGNHGISILSSRENLQLEESVLSDTAPLADLVQEMLSITKEIHVLRDPTRGGLATALNEIAQSSQVEIEIEEENIPIEETVKDACKILGYDPLYLANEGKLIAFLPEQFAEEVVQKMKTSRYGKQAATIGRVITQGRSEVSLKTDIGGRRIVGMLSGEQLPRIC
ncbi:MAG: hydrogenase expression/formation protein HypE [Atribacterota bacterium]|nr:hydrogenase expression/formation protein HypE [Atribacterota bacterium]MDD4896361.1 hydrogenase expression/formation protein HypE [Atribacterota bacterium]MDD5636633.1 hydrogenase expression/formation protein HypE [Atribacterota bacterium]